MNYLTLLGLFPKRINVTLIDSETEQLIDKRKILKDELPEIFNRPTVLSIDGEDYQVLKAHPVSGDGFYYDKRLTLHVRKKSDFDRTNVKPMVPTISGTNLEFCHTPAAFNITNDQWMQLQLLPASMSPLIEEEFAQIHTVMETASLSGYSKVYIRKNIPAITTFINKDDFYNNNETPQNDAIKINGAGTVKGSFISFLNERTYYGMILNNTITNLCLLKLDYIDENLMALLERHNLILVDWCNITTIR